MKRKSKLTLQERSVIEISLYQGMTLEEIGLKLDRHPTTIAREIKSNRTLVSHRTYFGNDCRRANICEKRNLCDKPECKRKCVACKIKNCHEYCKTYSKTYCLMINSSPYVCNNCKSRPFCNSEMYVYTAKSADEKAAKRRSDTRKGIRLNETELEQVDNLVSGLVKKGQPLSHIVSEHQNELPVGLRTIYNYIDAGELTIKNIDLRRKVVYRKRKKKHNNDRLDRQICRQGRTYEAFKSYIENTDENQVVEMDTVKGKREKSQCLLTMIFRKNSVMLIFLLSDCKAESVTAVFDFLEDGLGLERFMRLFPVVLTDNGSEFKYADRLETTKELEDRTKIFYCDPMASWQKPKVEKNHEFIRYIIPKGKSMAFLTEEKVVLLTNHINSIRRESLGGRSPWQVASEDEDMRVLMNLLNMKEIESDNVLLTPDLLDD